MLISNKGSNQFPWPGQATLPRQFHNIAVHFRTKVVVLLPDFVPFLSMHLACRLSSSFRFLNQDMISNTFWTFRCRCFLPLRFPGNSDEEHLSSPQPKRKLDEAFLILSAHFAQTREDKFEAQVRNSFSFEDRIRSVSSVLFKIYLTYSAKVRGLNFQIGLSSSPFADYLFFGCIFVHEEKHMFDLLKCRETVGI